MLQIKDTLVSLDVVERFFICDLGKCLGECCIEGDAGAPITKEEYEKLKEIVPLVWNDLMPQARKVIEEQGVGYIDEEGDLVTQIVDGRNCVFTCYGEGGMCQCAIEKAYRAGDRLLQAHFVPSLSATSPGAVALHGCEFPSLEDLQGCRGAWQGEGCALVSIPEGAADTAVWS